MDGWNTILSYWGRRPIFRGYVSCFCIFFGFGKKSGGAWLKIIDPQWIIIIIHKLLIWWQLASTMASTTRRDEIPDFFEKSIPRWWQLKHFWNFHPYLGKIPFLTNIFQMGWNHQLDSYCRWWQLKYFWNFKPDPWGNDAIWWAYFSKGLVQPPPRFWGKDVTWKGDAWNFYWNFCLMSFAFGFMGCIKFFLKHQVLWNIFYG